ncbi:Hypothetical protein, putative [Bodo saltans]|uniref:Uncharacterized protein n=1 Tax=Bodo saltans TaxID=75058 RepID=A0A0S4JUW7_BODSA|nr:Hypothetical protein, putative [Bodo saltans]|eukprot:CUG94098.1 Hypothetical protein, putative [Bodo saltans]
MSLMVTTSATAARTPASAPRTRSPARDANWNASSSMNAALSFAPVPVRRVARDPPRNPNEKAVSAPHANPVFTKKSATTEKSLIFTPLAAGANSHRVVKTSMHTDPFQAERQTAKPRPMYMSYGSCEHQQPHPAGRCHLQDYERENKGFVSVSGKVSFGGRRHTQGNPSLLKITEEPSPVPPTRSPMRRVVSPVSGMSADFPMRTSVGSSAPQRSPLRQRSPARDKPTLQGVLKPDPQPTPVGLISKPVWLGNSTNEKSPSTSSATRSCAPTAPMTAVSLPNGALDSMVVKQRKHYVSNRIVVTTKAPYHTTTPRQPSAGMKVPIARPYC